MTKLKRLLPAILDLFDGEAGATGEAAPDAAEQTGEELPQQSDADSAAQRTKAYDDFIIANKDLDDARIQKLVKGRLKGANDQIAQLQEANAGMQPIIDRLTAKYGVTDMEQLTKAIDNDTDMWEAEADRAGMTTEQYMKFQELQRENAQLIRQEQENLAAQEQQRIVNGWLQEAEQLKAMYPGFDLEQELQNEDFASLIQKRVPIEHAYKLIHLDEIMAATAQNSAASTEKAITEDIRANGMRPMENGIMSNSAFVTHTDVNNLTNKDMDDLIARAARGEIITLRQS